MNVSIYLILMLQVKRLKNNAGPSSSSAQLRMVQLLYRVPHRGCTHIISQKVVVERAAGFQPKALLGILVVLEESVLVRVAQSLDLGQPIPDLRAPVEHSRLKSFAILK